MKKTVMKEKKPLGSKEPADKKKKTVAERNRSSGVRALGSQTAGSRKGKFCVAEGDSIKVCSVWEQIGGGDLLT